MEKSSAPHSEVSEYNDVIHRILLEKRMLCEGCGRLFFSKTEEKISLCLDGALFAHQIYLTSSLCNVSSVCYVQFSCFNKSSKLVNRDQSSIIQYPQCTAFFAIYRMSYSADCGC